MAKRRGRPNSSGSIESLVAELRRLDQRRLELAGQLRQAAERLVSGDQGAPATARGIDVSGMETRSGGTRKRRGMTPAQRKAVGERMKKYWAARRKTDGKK